MSGAIAPSAIVSTDAVIGDGTRIWHFAQVREGAQIGRDCVLGTGVYIDAGVIVGDRCKVENNASLFAGTVVDDGVFIGPHACFTNDLVPRAVNADGSLKGPSDWDLAGSRAARGSSIGAGAVILPGVSIGAFALVGAGAVVTRDVAPFALVVGNPARQRGWVCKCGRERRSVFEPDPKGEITCPKCSTERVPTGRAR